MGLRNSSVLLNILLCYSVAAYITHDSNQPGALPHNPPALTRASRLHNKYERNMTATGISISRCRDLHGVVLPRYN
jgi:hypothetical protein